MSLYEILVYIHSGIRWLIILFMILSLLLSFRGWKSEDSFSLNKFKFFRYTVMIIHLQLVIGVALYVLSPKVLLTNNTMSSPLLRFYTVEHFLLMIIAIILVTVGLLTVRRVKEDKRKFKRIFFYYLIGFLIIIASTPWPFRNLGTGWF